VAVIRLGNLGWKNNTEPVSPTNPWHSKDVNSDAIKNKVDTLATETKLEQVRTLLAGVATEDKLEQARALLQTISGKDFATQTTLAQVKSELELVKAELQAIKANQLSGDQKVQLSGTIVVETVGDLPSTGYMAQVALVSEGQRVFIHDGNEWGEW
jgi:hypothetical protein